MTEKKKSKLFNNTKQTTLSGINIFKDKKGRNVYLNRFNKVGYIITEDDEKSYRMYAMRFVMGFIVFVLINGFMLPTYLAVIIGLGCYILMEVKFRNQFLPHLTQIPDFEPIAKESALDAASRDEQGRIIIKSCLYLAFAILMALNTYLQKQDNQITLFIEIMEYALAIGGFAMFIFQLFALNRHMKNKKESG